MAVVHFNMIVEINKLLKNHNINYSVHLLGGCACCGLELRKDNDPSFPIEDIVELINEYLKSSWIHVRYEAGILKAYDGRK